MNLMLEFVKDNRTTTHFRERAIVEIKIAYRIMEYLAPDSVAKPEVVLNGNIRDKLISGVRRETIDAINLIFEEFDVNVISHDKVIEVICYLLPIYMEKNATERDKERQELLLRLKELDNGVH